MIDLSHFIRRFKVLFTRGLECDLKIYNTEMLTVRFKLTSTKKKIQASDNYV